jgi:hypothetical protein
MNYFSLNYLQTQSSISSSTSLILNSNISLLSKIIFVIDDIHFGDESSLKHLLTLGSHGRSLLILSMKPTKNNYDNRSSTNSLRSLCSDSRVCLRRLTGLEQCDLASLGKNI